MRPSRASEQPLGFEHIARLEALLALTGRTPSEYSLPNLVLYRKRHRYRLIDGDSPFILGETYDGECHALPLCPLDAATASRLLQRADCIYPLAENEAAGLAAQGFRIDERAADADYLYDSRQLARLDKARTKRAQAAQFGKLDPQLGAFDPDAALALHMAWLDEAGRGPDYADAHECAEAIRSREQLQLEGLMVCARGRVMGFALIGAPRSGERIVHFAKGVRDTPGVYPWMFSRLAADCGVSRLNFEQDLGHPGLARAKQALIPVGKRRKYRLRKA